MLKNKGTLYLVQAAVIAALYAALTYAQNLLIPGSASMAIQFRVSEILTMLALFTPAAIPGLTIGCILANISSVSVLGPYDMIFGSLASLGAAAAIYLLRNARIFSIPIWSVLMPAIFNGVIVGWEIEFFFIEGDFNFISFLTQAGCVALGELAVCVILGIPLVKMIEKTKLDKRIFAA